MAKGKFNRKIIYLLVVALLATSFAIPTLAAYKTTESGSGSVTAANFVLNSDVVDDQSVQIAAVDCKPGMTAITYKIEVANFEDGVICDVSQEYTVSVSSTGNLPLTFELEKVVVDSDNIVYESYENGVTSAPDSFDAGSGRTDTYNLMISWKEDDEEAGEEYTDPKYASEIDLITVTVSSVQTMT